jgi:proline iminopeptidase
MPPSYARLVADRRTALDAFPAEMREVLLEGDEGGAGGANLSRAGIELYDRAWTEWIARHESSRAAGACYQGLRLGGAGDGYGALRGNAASATGRASAAAVVRDMTGGMMFSVGGALAGWEADDGGRLARLTASVPAVKMLHGANDALSAAAALEVFNGIAVADMKPRVTWDEVEGSGSCVHLDRSEVP